nr:uncharacterized protein LOC109620514 [Crassostrea gigas]
MVNLLAISTLFFVSTVCQRNAMKAKSETTHGFGRYRVNSLVRIRARDVRGPPMNTTEEIPVWSSVKGKYTPWIAYRGCYQISTLSTNQSTRSLMVNNNSVGACYWQCKMNALKKSLCENTTGIQFGLQKSHCFCYCKGPARRNLDQSDKCNITCSPSSFEDGECGGQGHFSAYEECKYTFMIDKPCGLVDINSNMFVH